MDFPLQYIIHVLEMDSSFVIQLGHITVVVCFSQVTARFSLSSIFWRGEEKANKGVVEMLFLLSD